MCILRRLTLNVNLVIVQGQPLSWSYPNMIDEYKIMEFFVFIIRLDLDQAARHIAKDEMSNAASNESVFETGLNRKAVNRDYYEFEGTNERKNVRCHNNGEKCNKTHLNFNYCCSSYLTFNLEWFFIIHAKSKSRNYYSLLFIYNLFYPSTNMKINNEWSTQYNKRKT